MLLRTFPVVCRAKYALSPIANCNHVYLSRLKLSRGRPFSALVDPDPSSIISELSTIVESGNSWESLYSDKRNLYQIAAICNSATAAKSSHSSIRDNFHNDLIALLDPETFNIVPNYSGFGPDLTVDFAVYYEGTLLGLIVLDEPEHYTNGALLPHHKIKELLYNIKYRENTLFFRLMITNLKDDTTRINKIESLVSYLVAHHCDDSEE